MGEITIYELLSEQLTKLNDTVQRMEIALTNTTAQLTAMQARVQTVEASAAAAHRRLDEGQNNLLKWFAGIAAAIVVYLLTTKG